MLGETKNLTATCKNHQKRGFLMLRSIRSFIYSVDAAAACARMYNSGTRLSTMQYPNFSHQSMMVPVDYPIRFCDNRALPENLSSLLIFPESSFVSEHPGNRLIDRMTCRCFSHIVAFFSNFRRFLRLDPSKKNLSGIHMSFSAASSIAYVHAFIRSCAHILILGSRHDFFV
jgi:hypothetical protein